MLFLHLLPIAFAIGGRHSEFVRLQSATAMAQPKRYLQSATWRLAFGVMYCAILEISKNNELHSQPFESFQPVMQKFVSGTPFGKIEPQRMVNIFISPEVLEKTFLTSLHTVIYFKIFIFHI